MVEQLTSMRKVIEWAEKRGELLTVDKEIDPVYDLAGFIAAMDGGPVLLFNKIKGYPGCRAISNLVGTRQRLADVVRATSIEYTGKAFLDLVKNPIPPKVVSHASCQENVITKDIDILKNVPVPTQTPRDAGRIITGGNVLVKVPGTDAFNISFHRMSVVGKDYTSIALSEFRHLTEIFLKARREKKHVPVTVNIGGGIGTPITSAGTTTSSITPMGYDELGLMGAINGAPVEIVPAKTVEGAWSLAEAEWVLEGYLTQELVHEEVHEEVGKHYFMGEYPGTLGFSWRTPKFQVTAITHRNQPIYYFPLATQIDALNMMALLTEANAYHACKIVNPEVFDTCFMLPAMRGYLGMVIRLNKRRASDDGFETSFLLSAAASSGELRWVIAVDQDVNLTDPNDVLWAMITRCDPKSDIWTIRSGAAETEHTGESGMGSKALLDATVSWSSRKYLERARFPKVNLENWISKEKIAEIKAKQANIGHATTLANLALDKDADWTPKGIFQPYKGPAID